MAVALVNLALAVRVADGRFTLGTLTLFLTYSSWLGQQMYFFGMILARCQGGGPCRTDVCPSSSRRLPGLGRRLPSPRSRCASCAWWA
ncbi:MAG: ATP-binding cassette subfamily protein [Actinomycetota bacterium]|nr:ATP-binding cassette subfamily protein [Actinomycetota bacterium]